MNSYPIINNTKQKLSPISGPNSQNYGTTQPITTLPSSFPKFAPIINQTPATLNISFQPAYPYVTNAQPLQYPQGYGYNPSPSPVVISQPITNGIPSQPLQYPQGYMGYPSPSPIITSQPITNGIPSQPLQYPRGYMSNPSPSPIIVSQPLTNEIPSRLLSTTQSMNAPSGQFKKKEDFYSKNIPDSWLRTSIIGKISDSSEEFDDYHQKLKDLFFTPELGHLKVYYTPDYIWGIQGLYRDSWGKDERESYKGAPHLGKDQPIQNYLCTEIIVDFDDSINDIRGCSGNGMVLGLSIKTFKGKTYNFGQTKSLGENLVEPYTKAIALGGSHNGYSLESLYFYLNQYISEIISQSI